MSSSSSSSSTILVAGSALVIAVVAATTLFGGSSSSSGPAIKDIDDMDEMNQDEMIQPEDVIMIFERLFLEMQQVLAQLSQQVQQIQMSGQVIPEPQLRQLLKAEFERALNVKQGPIFEHYGIDADCLEQATWEFLEQEDKYPKVKTTVERFQKLWENVSGESVVGIRPGKPETAKSISGSNNNNKKMELLSAAKTVEAAEVYFDSLTKAMSDLVQQFKRDGKNLQDTSVAQELHMAFAAAANDKGEEALKNIGIELNQFQKSIEANAQNPTVGRALAMLQMKQQQALMSMGVPTM